MVSEASTFRNPTLPRFPWKLWFCVSAAVAVLFSFTLTTAVPVWMDEAMIVESGRVALTDNPGFSAQQRSQPSRATEAPSALGPSLLELAFRVTNPSNAGPRAMALAGQLLAFGWLVYYLRLSGVGNRVSAALGIAFLLDPLCDISWRGGRVDSWEFAALFAAMAALRLVRMSPKSRAEKTGSLAAGAAVCVGFVLWPSFGLLLPLLAWEAWPLLRGLGAVCERMLWFSLGAGVVAIFYGFVFGAHVERSLDDVRYLSTLIAKHDLARGPLEQIQSLLWSLSLSPIVSVLGLAAMSRRPARLLGLATFIPMTLVFLTIVYRLRVLYLLPYFYVAASTLFLTDSFAAWRRTLRIGLAAAMLLGFGFTAVGTTMSGWSNHAGKDPVRLLEVGRREIGAGPHRVLIQDPDFYYTGRALGWQQLYCVDGCYGPAVEPWERAVWIRAEFAIVHGTAGCPNIDEWLRRGYAPKAIALPEGGVRSSVAGFPYGPPTYGPYCVFQRTAP